MVYINGSNKTLYTPLADSYVLVNSEIFFDTQMIGFSTYALNDGTIYIHVILIKILKMYTKHNLL